MMAGQGSSLPHRERENFGSSNPSDASTQGTGSESSVHDINANELIFHARYEKLCTLFAACPEFHTPTTPNLDYMAYAINQNIRAIKQKRDTLRNKNQAQETLKRLIRDHGDTLREVMETNAFKAIGELAKSLPEPPAPITQDNITEYTRDPVSIEESFEAQLGELEDKLSELIKAQSVLENSFKLQQLAEGVRAANDEFRGLLDEDGNPIWEELPFLDV